MPDQESIEITLGEHTFRALPQPHARLLHYIPGIVAGAVEDADGDVDGTHLVAVLGEGLYELLEAFFGEGHLRKKLPPWEFHGYANKEAWKAREYDDQAAQASPTAPQIITALDQLIALNGGDVFKKMFGWLDPKPIRAAISLRIAEAIMPEETEEDAASHTVSSPSSPPTNGASGPMSSGDAIRTSPVTVTP